MERFDVVIVGMGPGGEAAAGPLLAAGKRVAARDVVMCQRR